MVRQVKSWQKCMQLGIAAVAVVVISDVPAKAAPIMPLRPLVLANCRSTELLPPTEAEIESLQALILTYQVSVPRLKPSVATTRCQFGHALELTIERLNDLLTVSSGTVSRDAVETVNQLLFESYHAEVTSQLGIDDKLAARPTRLSSRQFSTTTKLSGEWILEPQFNEPPLPPLPPLPPNGGNAPAAPTDVQALDALTERHGCIDRYPDKTFQGDRTTTRYEFAAALNACVDRVEQLMAGGTVVSQADLSTLHRLETAYAGELAYLRRRVAQLEERTRRWEQQQAFEADLLATLKLPSTIKLSSEFLLKPQTTPLQTEVAPALPSVKLTDSETIALSEADFWTQYRQAATHAAALAAFHGRIDDHVEARAPITMKLSTTTRLSSASLLKTQSSTVTSGRQVLQASVERYVCIFGFSKSRIVEPKSIAFVGDHHVCIDQLEEQTKRQKQPFSPITKLHVETTLELSGSVGGNR